MIGLSLSELIQDADWKKEKHVPVIELPTAVSSGEPVMVEVSVGREIPHPNTPEHFIGWIKLFFHPEGAKFPVEVGDYHFSVHGNGEGAEGSPKAEPFIRAKVSFDTPGKLMALSYCNIHGLWQGEAEVSVE
ncbi:MAG: class II SORL domain-containing protein [Bacillota bacterium]